MVSQKKGFKRFYTQEIKEIKDQYNEAKAQTEKRSASGQPPVRALLDALPAVEAPSPPLRSTA